MYISGRERKIIKMLLNASQPKTIRHIAAELNVSERTIHRDLPHVQQSLQDHGLSLNRRTGKGLSISGDDTNQQNLKLVLNNIKHTDFIPEERQAMILLTLLEANTPVKLYRLAHELKVTVATISNDLNQVEEVLQKFRLTLKRRQGYGVEVKGNEADKRAAISYLFSKHVDEFSVVSLLKENIEKKAHHPMESISNRLLGFVPPKKIQIIEREVDKIKEELPYELADNAYIGLVVHLALAIERIEQGDHIEFDPEQLKQMEQAYEYSVASKLIHNLETAINLSMPEDEIGYITMHLMGARLRINHDYMIEGSNLDIAYRAKELIHYVSDYFSTDLAASNRLLNDLVAHLQPAIYRLKQRMNIKNPIVDQIKADYPDLFQVIKNGVKETFPDVAFPDEEIGYLALHFGSALLQSEGDRSLKALVVCASGIGTAKMLATKLQRKFPVIKQVENKSLFDLAELNLNPYDLIVSTIPLEGIDREYVIASPMLEQTDVHRIEKAVRQTKINLSALQKEQKDVTHQQTVRKTDKTVKNIRSIQHESTAVVQLLDHFHMTKVHSKLDKKEILQQALSTLQREGILEDDSLVLNQLLEREHQGGLGIPDTRLMLYHTRSDSVKTLSFTIYSLHHPLNVLGMNGEPMEVDQLLLMLAPKQTTRQSLEILSFLSGLLVQDDVVLKTLQTGDESLVKYQLAKQLKQYITQKITK